MAAPGFKLPKLNLRGVESGGGWAVGERYAAVAPADEQLRGNEAAYVVAGDDNAPPDDDHTSDLTDSSRFAAGGAGPTADQANLEGAADAASDSDSGGTFVDYGVSPANKKTAPAATFSMDPRLKPAPQPAADKANGNHHSASPTAAPPPPANNTTSSAAPPPPSNGAVINSKHSGTPNNAADDDDDEPLGMSARRRWQPAEIVSTLELQLPVRAMEVVRDKVWAAVGDGPLACYSLVGRDLSLHLVAPTVTTIRSICYVPEAARLRADADSDLPPPPAASKWRGGDALWCGTDDGKIIVFSLFFECDDGALLAPPPGPSGGMTSQVHSGPVTHLVRLPNDRVWSAGKDKYIRIWDVATRKLVARKELSVAPRDMCPVLSHVWTFSPQEQCIRLWSTRDGSTTSKVTVRAPAGAAVGQLTAPMPTADGSGNTSGIFVKYEVLSLKYHAPSRSVWVCIFEHVFILAVRSEEKHVTATLVHDLPMTAPNVDFIGDTTAILIGRHREESGHDYIAAFRLATDVNVAPQIIHRGSLLAGVSAVGVRHLRDTPFAVVAHTNMRNTRCLSVITTDHADPVGAWGNPGHDAAIAAIPSLVSRSDSNQSTALHRMGSGPHPAASGSRGPTPAQAAGPHRLSKTGSMTTPAAGRGDDDRPPAAPTASPPVDPASKQQQQQQRPTTPPLESHQAASTLPPPQQPAQQQSSSNNGDDQGSPMNNNNANANQSSSYQQQQQPAPAMHHHTTPEHQHSGGGAHGDESTASSQVISASTQARTTNRGGGNGTAHTSPSGPHQRGVVHPVNTSFTDSTPFDGNTGRLAQNHSSNQPTGQRPYMVVGPGFPHMVSTSPPGSSARDAVSRVERKVDDVARHVRRLKVSQERSNDFQALVDEVLKLQTRLETAGHAALPPLRDGQAEEIDARFQTGEGRTIATVISRLERGISAKAAAATAAAEGKNGAASPHASPMIAMRRADGDDSMLDDLGVSNFGDGGLLQMASLTRVIESQRRADRAFYEGQLKETQRQLRQATSKISAITHGWARLLAELELATAVAPPPTVRATAASHGVSSSAVVADLFAADGGLGINERSSTASIAFAFNTVSGLLRSHILQGRTIAPHSATADVADRHVPRADRHSHHHDVTLISSDGDEAGDDLHATTNSNGQSRRTNGGRRAVSSSRRGSTTLNGGATLVSPSRGPSLSASGIHWSLAAQLGMPHLHQVQEFAVHLPDRLRLLLHSTVVIQGHTSPQEASGLLLLRAELFAELCGHEAVMEIAEAVTYDWPTLHGDPTATTPTAAADQGATPTTTTTRPATRTSNASNRATLHTAPLTPEERALLKQYNSLVAAASLRLDEAGLSTRTGLSALTIASLNIAGLSASPDPRESRRAGHHTSAVELRRLLVDTSFPVGERSFKGFTRWIALWALCFSYYLSHVERTVHRAAAAAAASQCPPTPDVSMEDASAPPALLPASATSDGISPRHLRSSDSNASSNALTMSATSAETLRAEALREVKTAASRFDALTNIERRTRFLLAFFYPDETYASLRASSSRGGRSVASVDEAGTTTSPLRSGDDETSVIAKQNSSSAAAVTTTRFPDIVSVNPFAAYLHGSSNGHDVLALMEIDKGLEDALENATHTFAEIRLGARGLQEYALQTLGATTSPVATATAFGGEGATSPLSPPLEDSAAAAAADIETLKTRLAALQVVTKHWNAALNSASRSTPATFQ